MTDHVNAEDDLVANLRRLVRWCRAADPLATIYLHAIEAVGYIEAVRSTRDGEIERLREALVAIEKTTLIGATTTSEETLHVAVESAHDIANSALNQGTPNVG